MALKRLKLCLRQLINCKTLIKQLMAALLQRSVLFYLAGDPCSGVTCSNNGKCMSFSSLFNSKPKHRPDDNENSNEDDYMGPNFPPTNTNQNYMCLCNSGYEGVNCEFPSGSKFLFD